MTVWRGECPRCKRTVRVERPWRGWWVLRGVWYAGVGALMISAPLIAAEVTVLTPLAVMFLGAGALVIERSREPPRCRRCLRALEPAQLRRG